MTRAGILVAAIFVGYLLRRSRFLPPEAFTVVSRIVLNVTLPCAVIVNFADFQVSGALLWLFPLGFFCKELGKKLVSSKNERVRICVRTGTAKVQ